MVENASTSASTKTTVGANADSEHTDAAGRASAEIDLIRFELLRSALYHDRLQRRYRALNRILMLAMIIMGSSAFAGFGQTFPASWGIPGNVVGQISGLTVAVIGAVSLVWGFGEAAVLHGDLRRRFYQLLADAERGADVVDLTSRMTMIYVDEPPLNDKINAWAHDRSGDVIYGPGNYRKARDKSA